MLYGRFHALSLTVSVVRLKEACLKPDAIYLHIFTKPESGKRKKEMNNPLPKRRYVYEKL